MLSSLVLIRGIINGVLIGMDVVLPYIVVAAVLAAILALMCKFVKNPKITKWVMIVVRNLTTFEQLVLLGFVC